MQPGLPDRIQIQRRVHVSFGQGAVHKMRRIRRVRTGSDSEFRRPERNLTNGALGERPKVRLAGVHGINQQRFGKRGGQWDNYLCVLIAIV